MEFFEVLGVFVDAWSIGDYSPSKKKRNWIFYLFVIILPIELTIGILHLNYFSDYSIGYFLVALIGAFILTAILTWTLFKLRMVASYTLQDLCFIFLLILIPAFILSLRGAHGSIWH